MKIEQYNEAVVALINVLGSNRPLPPELQKKLVPVNPADQSNLSRKDWGTECSKLFDSVINYCLDRNDAGLLLSLLKCCAILSRNSNDLFINVLDHAIAQWQLNFLEKLTHALEINQPYLTSMSWVQPWVNELKNYYASLPILYPVPLLEQRQAQFRNFVITNFGLPMLESIGNLGFNDDELKKLILQTSRNIYLQNETDQKIRSIMSLLEDRIRKTENFQTYLAELESAKEKLLSRRPLGILASGSNNDQQMAAEIGKLISVIIGIKLDIDQEIDVVIDRELSEEEMLIYRIQSLSKSNNNIHAETQELAGDIRKFVVESIDNTKIRMTLCQFATLELMYQVDDIGYSDKELIVFLKCALNRTRQSNDRFYHDVKIKRFLDDLDDEIARAKDNFLSCILEVYITRNRLRDTSTLAAAKLGPNHELIALLNKVMTVLEFINSDVYYMCRNEGNPVTTVDKIAILQNDIRILRDPTTKLDDQIRNQQTQKFVRRVLKLYKEFGPSPRGEDISHQLHALRNIIIENSSITMFHAIGDLEYTPGEAVKFLRGRVNAISISSDSFHTHPGVNAIFTALIGAIRYENSLEKVMLEILKARYALQKLGDSFSLRKFASNPAQEANELLCKLEIAVGNLAVVKAVENKIMIVEEIPPQRSFGSRLLGR